MNTYNAYHTKLLKPLEVKANTSAEAQQKAYDQLTRYRVRVKRTEITVILAEKNGQTVIQNIASL